MSGGGGGGGGFFFQAEDGIRDYDVTGVQTCALPISNSSFPLSQEIESQVDTNAKHPRAKTTRRVKLVEPLKNPQKSLLSQIACLLAIVHKLQNHTHQALFVTLDEFPKRVAVTTARFFHEPGIANPRTGADVCRKWFADFRLRLHSIMSSCRDHSHPIIRQSQFFCWMRREFSRFAMRDTVCPFYTNEWRFRECISQCKDAKAIEDTCRSVLKCPAEGSGTVGSMAAYFFCVAGAVFVADAGRSISNSGPSQSSF